MNPPQKAALQQVNVGALRLELLMRAHEVARRINERVRCALDNGKPASAAPPSGAGEAHSAATPQTISEQKLQSF